MQDVSLSTPPSNEFGAKSKSPLKWTEYHRAGKSVVISHASRVAMPTDHF
jgi:hypothetical protein